jgi:hypothetical protein
VRLRDGGRMGGGVGAQWAFRKGWRRGAEVRMLNMYKEGRVENERLRVRMLNMSMEGRVENERLRVRMLNMSMEGRVENGRLRVRM